MATWTLHSQKYITKESLCLAAADAFHLRKDEVYFRTGSFYRDESVKIYIEEYDYGADMPFEFRFKIRLCIEPELYADTGYPAKGSDGLVKDNLNLAKKIVPFLQEPLVGEVEDYNRNDIYYYKCYPDGREERIEWPEED